MEALFRGKTARRLVAQRKSIMSIQGAPGTPAKSPVSKLPIASASSKPEAGRDRRASSVHCTVNLEENYHKDYAVGYDVQLDDMRTVVGQKRIEYLRALPASCVLRDSEGYLPGLVRAAVGRLPRLPTLY